MNGHDLQQRHSVGGGKNIRVMKRRRRKRLKALHGRRRETKKKTMR